MWRVAVILILSIIAFVCVLFALYARSRMHGWRCAVVCVAMSFIVFGCSFGIVSSADSMSGQADACAC